MGASFTPLGFLPGDDTSTAVDVSADGSVVVGSSLVKAVVWSTGRPLDVEAFRWTRDGGMVGLGYAPSDSGSFAYGVSADGAVVVGTSFVALYGDAFRWTHDGGMARLGALQGNNYSYASATSADGSIVVGQSHNGWYGGVRPAFRWTIANGMIDLGDLPGGDVNSGANDVSADGSVVVGWSSSGNNSVQAEAFRWTDSGGMIGLGNLPGFDFESRAEAVSSDGSVVVGSSAAGPDGDYREAFRWTSDDGMIGLGDLPGGSHRSVANDVSANGSVVVGWGHSASGQEAFVWDAATGIRRVSDVLTDLGMDLTGWKLTQATAVSADGTIIVGSGINSLGQAEAWLAHISAVPEPSAVVSTFLALATFLGSRPARND
jgi:probable HAF family extracellular repeat protein